MRAAFCLTGEPRTFEFCYPSIQKFIIDVYHPDIFICTDGGHGDRFSELYNPLEMHVVSQMENSEAIRGMRDKYTNHPIEAVVENNASLFYKWKICGSLKEKHGEYDVVIFGRPDMEIVRFDPGQCDMEKGTIYLPRVDALGNSYGNDGILYGGWGGQLSFGDESVAKVFSSMYDNIESLYDQNKEWHTERLFMKHCLNSGIKRKPFEINFRLVRSRNA